MLWFRLTFAWNFVFFVVLAGCGFRIHLLLLLTRTSKSFLQPLLSQISGAVRHPLHPQSELIVLDRLVAQSHAIPARNHGCLTISTSGTVSAGFAAGFDLFIIAAAFALIS